jgi:SAM-dependent methyltransferase
MPTSSATRDHFERTAAFWRDVYGSPSVEGAVYLERQRKALALVDGLKLGPGAKAIEIGCGAGWNAVALAERGLLVQATDPVEKMLRMTRELAAARRVEKLVGVSCCAGEALPFADESFDLAVGIAVMEWADSPDLMLAELSRVLRPGGHLILSATNRCSLQRVMDPWFNPLWAPLKNWMSKQAHVGNRAHARTHSSRDMDRLLGLGGLKKGECFTTGFGPFTFFKHKLFRGAAGARLHEHLERLAGGGWHVLARSGYAHLVRAQKPVSQPDSGDRKDEYSDTQAA